MVDKNDKIMDAYKLAISARNFHLDHFNKWMTYYYVAVAAIFVAFYNLKDTCNSNIVYGLLILGFLVSVLWHLSCKGYYFWTKNWLDVVLKFEKQLSEEQAIYSLFSKRVKNENDKLYLPTQSANVSTSKVTLLLSFIASWTWAFLIFDKFDCINIHTIWKILFSLLTTIGLIWGLGILLKSDISKHKLFDNQ